MSGPPAGCPPAAPLLIAFTALLCAASPLITFGQPPAVGVSPANEASRVRSYPRGAMRSGAGRVIAEGLIAPEAALYDERNNQFLVSNMNGPLTAKDDNGFISRLAADGGVLELDWIDGRSPDFLLHAPKGMAFRGDELIVADLDAVRVFDRRSGQHIRDWEVPGSYMLNDVAIGDDGTVYVTDTGGDFGTPPGAVYAIGEDGKPRLLARGAELERPNGLVYYERSLLVAAYASDANEVYRLGLDGRKAPYGTVPARTLDGLIRLPDGTLLVTSWSSNSVYRLLGSGPHAELVASGVLTPAQIAYDAKNSQLLVPDPLANRVVLFPIEWR
jgi:sugar lactone lactonase YvrE